MIDKIKAEILKSLNAKWSNESIRMVHLEAYRECLGWAEELEKKQKSHFVDAWSILQNNRIMIDKNNPNITKRDIKQREDEIGLLYSALFDMSYNDAIIEIEKAFQEEKGTK